MLFLTGIYILGVIVWGNIIPPTFKGNLFNSIGSLGYMNTRIKELKQYGKTDLLILGSSHAYRGFDPRIFNTHKITAFNLGSSAQTPIQSLVLLKRYLEQTQPQRVLLEVNPISISSDGVESSLDLIANDKKDLLTYKMALEINNIKTYNALIYAQYRELFCTQDDAPAEPNVDQYISGGYVERKRAFYKASPIPKQKIHFNDEQLKALQLCIQEIQGKNIEPVLVFAPVTNHLYRSYTNIPEFDSIMKGLGSYYNFNRLLPLSDSLDFYDFHHLNQHGVQKFNQKLIEVLGLED